MDAVSANNVAKSATSVVDNAADKLRGGIHDAQQSAKGVGAAVGEKVDEFSRNARQMLDSGTDQVKQGIGSVKDTFQGARQRISSSTDAVVSYTQENPVKSLLIAAACGAVLWTLIKAVASSRD